MEEVVTLIILPFAIDFFNKKVQKEEEKVVVAFITCVVAAVALNWQSLTNTFSIAGVGGTLFLLFSMSYLIFKGWYRRSTVRTRYLSLIGVDQENKQ